MPVPVFSADSPASTERVVPSAASVALAPLLRGPVHTGRVVAATSSIVAVLVDTPVPDVVCVTSTAGELPCAMAVDGSVPPVAVGAAATVGSGRVQLPGSVVTTARWRPVRPPVLADPGVARARAGRCVLPDLPPPLVDRADALAAALAAAPTSSSALAEPVRALLGFGPGLTPAGDDVLTAAQVALRAAHDPAAALLAGALVAARPFERTTAISAALLRLAATGLAISQLTHFVEALGAPAADLSATSAALLHVGHTSGAAMCLGAVTALRERGPA